MRIVIVEDEKVAADKLENQLKELDDNYQIVAKLGSIKESVKWFSSNRADLIFLDIQLSDGLSFSIFEEVEVITPVIFTTAYDQYSIKAFQLNSLAYLLKPIRLSELKNSLAKYKTLKSAFVIDFEQIMPIIKGEKPDYKKRFIISYGEKLHKVESDKIAYFYSMDGSTFIKTFENKSFSIEYSLERLENLLNPEKFFRINRKLFVNIEAINQMFSWSRGRVKLDLQPEYEDEMATIVSIERANDFKSWLDR